MKEEDIFSLITKVSELSTINNNIVDTTVTIVPIQKYSWCLSCLSYLGFSFVNTIYKPVLKTPMTTAWNILEPTISMEYIKRPLPKPTSQMHLQIK